MLRKIDDWFISIAKKMIQIAAFFGISRKQLMLGWIYFGAIFAMWSLHSQKLFLISGTIAIIIGWIFAHFAIVPSVIHSYREDNVLDGGSAMSDRKARLFFLILWGFVAYQSLLYRPFFQGIVYWLIIPKLINIYFWPYFCLNQNANLKVTARDWINAIKKDLKHKTNSVPEANPAQNVNQITR